MSREIKKITKQSGGIILQRGEWERNRPTHLAEIANKDTADKPRYGTATKKVQTALKEAIVIRKAEGATIKDIAEEFGVAQRYVEQVMKFRFPDGKSGAQKLRDLLLSNAIQLGAQTRMKADEMNGMQSAVATGIMTSKYIELDKHMQNKPPTIDLDKIGEISDSLNELTDIVRKSGVDDSVIPDVD